jgi:L-asparagine transporter-like permease
MSLFRKKSLEHLLAQADDSGKGLKRTLTAWSLIALGIGAIIGAGLFVRTAAAAGGHAGPAVTLSFIISAVGCAFAGYVMQSLPHDSYHYAVLILTHTTMGRIDSMDHWLV